LQEEPLLEEEEKWVTTDDEGEEEGGRGGEQQEKDIQLEEDVFVPPDGGYGWFVTLGRFIKRRRRVGAGICQVLKDSEKSLSFFID
jgi:hypothetical protein